jgi:hypothetical protein
MALTLAVKERFRAPKTFRAKFLAKNFLIELG